MNESILHYDMSTKTVARITTIYEFAPFICKKQKKAFEELIYHSKFRMPDPN
ncbi:hypothetical protein [Lederbergia galactosidilytica]|uniref:hypothetical protein n=1 Tax=Lederbergia galactosidilytica TaxID=217031 RepID=UPI001AE86F8F|nr:hypothetical protein [Lederbergia galactosidilytica]